MGRNSGAGKSSGRFKHTGPYDDDYRGLPQRIENTRKADRLLGPWPKGAKAGTTTQLILGQDYKGATSKRLSADQTIETVKKFHQVQARKSQPISQSTEKEIPVTANSITAVQRTTPLIINAEYQDLLSIKELCWDKIRFWVNRTSQEISGLGCIKLLKNNTFLVYDVFLLKQKNTSSFTDIDDLAVQQLMLALDAEDEKDKGSRLADLRFWWHSHANMGTFWSSQDDFNIEQKLFGSSTEGAPLSQWWVSLVTNRVGDVLSRLDTSRPWMKIDKIGHSIVDHEIAPDIKEFCENEYKTKVEENTYTASSNKNINNIGNYYKYRWDSDDINDYLSDLYGGIDLTSSPVGVAPNESKETEKVFLHQLNISGKKEMSLEEAFREWNEELYNGLTLLDGLYQNQKIYSPRFYGLCFEILENKGAAQTWNLSGCATIGDLMLVVWPGSQIMHLAKITDVSKDENIYSKNQSSSANMFKDVQITLDPPLILPTEDTKFPQVATAVIFEGAKTYTNKHEVYGTYDTTESLTDSAQKETNDFVEDFFTKESPQTAGEAAAIADDTFGGEGECFEITCAVSTDEATFLVDTWAEKQDKEVLKSRIRSIVDRLCLDDLIVTLEDLLAIYPVIDTSIPDSCNRAEATNAIITLYHLVDKSEFFSSLLSTIDTGEFCPECYEPLLDGECLCQNCGLEVFSEEEEFASEDIKSQNLQEGDAIDV